MAARHGTISPTLRAGVPFLGGLWGGGGWRLLRAPTHGGGGCRWEPRPAWPKKPGGVPWARGPLQGRTSDSPGGTPLSPPPGGDAQLLRSTLAGGGVPHLGTLPPPDPPFRPVVVSLRGPGQSPIFHVILNVGPPRGVGVPGLCPLLVTVFAPATFTCVGPSLSRVPFLGALLSATRPPVLRNTSVADPPPFSGSKNHESFGFFSILSRKSVSGSRLHGVCMGRSGTSANAAYAPFSRFCYVGGFGNLGDPVLPTLRGVSGDVVTVNVTMKGRLGTR